MTTPTLGFASPLDTSLSGLSASIASDVPGRFHCALAGHSYMIDLANDLNGFRGTHFTRKSVPILRAQADTANIPGEQSLNRETEWRRVAENWNHGAGQTYFDRADSDPARFNTSKGVNCWDKWQLSLLNDTSNQRASVNTNLRLTVCGGFVYVADGNTLAYTANINASPVVWTTVTGTPATQCAFLTSDGSTVYAAFGASGIYSTAAGTASAASFNPTAATIVGYTKGRLMAANGNALYNITSATTQTLILTHPNTSFAWVGFAEGPGYIYAAGYAGNKSLIYKLTIQTDGTALASPIVAGELPTGETVRTIKGYLGTLSIGTDLGVRFATLSASGDLTIGALITTSAPVMNFEPAGRFVWYALTNYDATSTGLGRLTPTTFTEPLVPSYASDVMAAAQGTVLSIAIVGNTRIFTVSGVGVFVEGTAKVASGTLTSGRIAFGIGDSKVGMFLELRTAPLAGSVTVQVAGDSGNPLSVGGSTAVNSTRPDNPLNLSQLRAEYFETTLTLTRDTVVTNGPVVTRSTLRAYPAPTRSFTFTVPLILHTQIRDAEGNDYFYDVAAERAFLENLLLNQTLVSYQQGRQSYSVLVDDLIWIPIKPTGDRRDFDGTLVAELKAVS